MYTILRMCLNMNQLDTDARYVETENETETQILQKPVNLYWQLSC